MITSFTISALKDFEKLTSGKTLLVFVANSDESPKRGGGLIQVAYPAFLEFLGANGIESFTAEEIYKETFALDNFKTA